MNYLGGIQEMRNTMLLSMLLVAAIMGWGQEAKNTKKPSAVTHRYTEDTFVIVKRFIYSAYPQLKETYELQLRVDDLYNKVPPSAPKGVGFTVEDFCKAPVPQNASSYHARQPDLCHVFYPDRSFLMQGFFSFTPSGQIREYEGYFVEMDKKLQSAIAKINYSDDLYTIPNDHKPSEDEISQRLVHAGAQYPPDRKDAFEEVLKEQHLSDFFGKSRIQSIDFIYWTKGHGEPVLQWLVQLETSETHKTYLLFYNSFDGSLRRVLSSADITQFDLK
jgi:hypothetical protein